MLSVQGQGLIFTIIIFLCCVIVVHAFVLAKIGYRTLHKNCRPNSPPKNRKKTTPFISSWKKRKNA